MNADNGVLDMTPKSQAIKLKKMGLYESKRNDSQNVKISKVGKYICKPCIREEANIQNI